MPDPSTNPPALPPSPGYRTSEALGVLVATLAPIGTIIMKALGGWQLVAALGIAALVAMSYLGARTLLKLRGVAVVLVLLCGSAHAMPPTAGVALPPGDDEIAAEKQSPKLRPYNPCELGPTRWLDTEGVKRMLAQADPPVQPPVAPPAPPVVVQAPPPAPASPAPIVPPEAIIAPSPCEVCAGQIGSAIGKPPAKWPTWAQVLIGVVGAALAGLEVADRHGAFAGVK